MQADSTQARFPIRNRPLRNPGDSLLEEHFETVGRCFPWIMAATFICIFAVMDWFRFYGALPPAPYFSTTLAVMFLAIAVVVWRRTARRVDHLLVGRAGERAVGQLLETLRADGFEVMHDICEDGFNVDHVLMGPPGVFVVETKTHRKRGNQEVTFDGKVVRVAGQVPDRDPIKQALAASQHVRELLSRTTAKAPPVRSVVLYPGWYVKSPLSHDIWVLNENSFCTLLRTEEARLTPEDVRLFANALATHVRAREAAMA